MADDLSRMTETFIIRGLLQRYCRAIDRLDAELLESCYWPEATDHHGSFTGPARNFIDGVISRLRDRDDATMHHLGQSIIDIDGDRAHAETYNIACHRSSERDRTTLVTVGNRYVDVLERRDGEWRILDRKVIIEWSKREDDVAVSHSPENFPLAHRDRNDPAYARIPAS